MILAKDISFFDTYIEARKFSWSDSPKREVVGIISTIANFGVNLIYVWSLQQIGSDWLMAQENHYNTEILAMPSILINYNSNRNSCGVMANKLNCNILASKLEHQLHYHAHFWVNTLRKGMNPLILHAVG